MDDAAAALLRALKRETYLLGTMAMCHGCLWGQLLEHLEAEGRGWRANYNVTPSNRLRSDATRRSVPVRVGLVSVGQICLRMHIQVPWHALDELFEEPVLHTHPGQGTSGFYGRIVDNDEAHEAAKLLVHCPAERWHALDCHAFWNTSPPPAAKPISTWLQPCRNRVARWQRACWLANYMALLDCNVCVLHALAHAVQHTSLDE